MAKKKKALGDTVLLLEGLGGACDGGCSGDFEVEFADTDFENLDFLDDVFSGTSATRTKTKRKSAARRRKYKTVVDKKYSGGSRMARKKGGKRKTRRRRRSRSSFFGSLGSLGLRLVTHPLFVSRWSSISALSSDIFSKDAISAVSRAVPGGCSLI